MTDNEEEINDVLEGNYDLSSPAELDEEYKPLTSEEYRSKQANKLEQMDKARELDKKRPKKDPHYMHPQASMALGGGLVTSGFLMHEGMFYIAIIGFIYTVKESVEFLPGTDESKFGRLIAHHPSYYILGVAASLLMFTAAGYQVPEIPLSMTDILLTALGI
jgi:hypothetical protein